jgi:hypothetical protein
MGPTYSDIDMCQGLSISPPAVRVGGRHTLNGGIDMSNLRVVNNLGLDGVMQAPGRPDVDTRDGFEHGGWVDSVTAATGFMIATYRPTTSGGRRC